jgi:hypothetical protein
MRLKQNDEDAHIHPSTYPFEALDQIQGIVENIQIESFPIDWGRFLAPAARALRPLFSRDPGHAIA